MWLDCVILPAVTQQGRKITAVGNRIMMLEFREFSTMPTINGFEISELIIIVKIAQRNNQINNLSYGSRC